MARLWTVEESDAYHRHVMGTKNLLTGVECPNCKNELQYKNKFLVTCSTAPSTEVFCFECNYSTSLYVNYYKF